MRGGLASLPGRLVSSGQGKSISEGKGGEGENLLPMMGEERGGRVSLRRDWDSVINVRGEKVHPRAPEKGCARGKRRNKEWTRYCRMCRWKGQRHSLSL